MMNLRQRPLKEEIIGDGFDMVIMREFTGGLYFGNRYNKEIDGLETAVDTTYIQRRRNQKNCN